QTPARLAWPNATPLEDPGSYLIRADRHDHPKVTVAVGQHVDRHTVGRRDDDVGTAHRSLVTPRYRRHAVGGHVAADASQCDAAVKAAMCRPGPTRHQQDDHQGDTEGEKRLHSRPGYRVHLHRKSGKDKVDPNGLAARDSHRPELGFYRWMD